MKDEVEESVVDGLLKKFLQEERSLHSAAEFERRARATLLRVVEPGRVRGQRDRANFREALDLVRRLLAATANHPGMLAKALGYRVNSMDAERQAMMRVVELLHNDPLPEGSTGGRAPSSRGHRIKADADECMLCGAPYSSGKNWRSDCPKNSPQRVRTKSTCAIAVAEAAQKAGIRNAQGKPIDSSSVLKMYNRWQMDGAPREREHDRLLRSLKG